MALGVDPVEEAHRVLFVGDSPVDEGAAAALGCAFAWASDTTALHEVLRTAFLAAGASPIDAALALVAPRDADAEAAAIAHQASLLKPAGALGLLESIGIQLAAIGGQTPPEVPHRAVVGVFGADHGVHDEGVSPWPQIVTAQMAAAVAGGGAAVSVLARLHGATVRMVDVGIATPTDHVAGIEQWTFRDGTANLAAGPAMSRVDALAAMSVGALVAMETIDAGADIVCTGDLGIANTTASAALIAALTRSDAAAVTGRGTGIDDATLSLKTDVVAAAVERVVNRNPSLDPLVVLEEVGGLEHAAIAGFIIGAASARVPVVLDGVIAVSAALVAVGLSPTVRDSLIGGHRSAEPGATIALAHLGIEPLVDLGMRLGEGTGAVSALPLIRSAAAIMAEMATFESAGLA
ncbi:MAG: nicotinate-nucleotide--dimethylbenzimidazole phosphoribosyltransferase [Actinobacteria bacterium]|nr:nicotinate-nucleotide--dimethylbenzimidazole phosphoribosyltransferase [Actinomycetota bacterium]